MSVPFVAISHEELIAAIVLSQKTGLDPTLLGFRKFIGFLFGSLRAAEGIWSPFVENVSRQGCILHRSWTG